MHSESSAKVLYVPDARTSCDQRQFFDLFFAWTIRIAGQRHKNRENMSTVERPVSTRVVVVVVVVRELFSLVTSAICVRIRGHMSEVTRLFTTWLMFSSTAAFLPQWIRFHFIFLCKH